MTRNIFTAVRSDKKVAFPIVRELDWDEGDRFQATKKNLQPLTKYQETAVTLFYASV